MTMKYPEVPHLSEMFKGEMPRTAVEMFKPRVSDYQLGDIREEIQVLDGMLDKTPYNSKILCFTFTWF